MYEEGDAPVTKKKLSKGTKRRAEDLVTIVIESEDDEQGDEGDVNVPGAAR